MPISHLNRWQGPTTVIRGIITVVINTMQRMFGGRCCAHIGEEFLKRCVPRFADAYASTAISLIKGCMSIIAALTHSEPNLPFTGMAHHMSRIRRWLVPKATATLDSAAYQIMRLNYGLLATGAATSPTVLGSFSVLDEQSRQLMKCAPCQIKSSHKSPHKESSVNTIYHMLCAQSIAYAI